MTKRFLTLTMILLGLFTGANNAWSINISGMTPEEAETMAFWARLTAKPAETTNGSGKVFVVASDNYSSDPADGDYQSVSSSADGWSDIYLASSLINADVPFYTYAKANAGSYFTGWSFTDGYVDLGTQSSNFSISVTPSASKGHSKILEKQVYAAFETIKLVSYTTSGPTTTAEDGEGNWKCTQEITFRAETPGGWALSALDDTIHFKLPVVTRKDGTTGTWSTIDFWNGNVSMKGDYALLTVPVTFTAPNGDAAEYGATLTLETYAGVKMNVYLSARTTGGDYEAIRYNKNKEQQQTGSLATLLNQATTDDIIKLNGNYSGEVTLNKNITFDLNGFTLSNTLKVSGGTATIAYSPYGGSANALNVTGGKAILNGGTFGSLTIGESGMVEQNGATITGAATNNGTLTTTDGKFQSGLTSSKTLTVNGGTFSGGVAINVTGGTATIKRGTIAGSTYGVQSAGNTTIEKLATITGTTALKRTAGSLTVNNGKFSDPANLAEGEIIFNAGYFRTNNAGDATAFDKQVWRNTAGPESREGYAFFVGDQAAAQASNVSVCRIGQASFSSLEDALAYANNSGKEVFIIMENDYVLPAGYYTLPANATLIVPMSNDQETANPVVPRETSGTPTPVSFRKLTFADGVNMSILGTIELTCTQHGSGETMGIPGGNYGHLILKPGSRVTINNGGELRAWGFVTGDGTKDGEGNYLSGEIDARRGAVVREMFQMGDWKGGDISLTMVMPVVPYSEMQALTHLFPVYTYFIQNVESPVKYHPGAELICATSVNVQGSINAYANDIKVVGKEGEAAMFLMNEMADAENTWVRKWYDAKKDQQVYEVNSGAQLGSVVIDLGEIPGAMFGGGGTFNIQLDSRKFVLPLTNNFKIHLLSGKMQFTQSTSCLPGMEVEIDKESEVSIIKNADPSIVSGALYFYDADQWSFQNNQTYGYVGNSGRFGAIVRYSPTWDLGTDGAIKRPNVRDISSPATIGDAKLNVHGTFRMGANCAVYTTWAKDNTLMALDEDESATGGASIVSTNEDAGTFIFDAPAPTFEGVTFDGEGNLTSLGPDVLVNYDHNDYGLGDQYPIQQTTIMGGPTPLYGWELCTSAKLRNADGTFVSTAGTSAGKSYCFMDGEWSSMTVDPDVPCFMIDAQDMYYAKPAEYVAIIATKQQVLDEHGDPVLDFYGNPMYECVGNADHTFSDANGEGRLFILMNDDTHFCQWWEVEQKDNLYHCIHPENDTYYYWDEDEGMWMEKRYVISWKNWNDTLLTTIDQYGTKTKSYSVTYGTMAEFLGTNPTRDANIDYTYDFTGWTPALGPVTKDVTYTATYTAKQRMYTIIFLQEGGVEIERHFLKHNDLPVCENIPTKPGHTLQWYPALAAVTGDATYTATWLEEPPTEYEITFVDYDGTTVLQQGNVAVGELPTAPSVVDGIPVGGGKPQTDEYTYVFDHWSPAVEEVTQAMTYTAVYREEPKLYTIFFLDEEGAQIEFKKYHYGETPVCSNPPTKAATAEWTYTLAWTPQIQTVMGDATYRADFDTYKTKNKYTAAVKCSPAGAATVTGGGIYEYNTEITINVDTVSGYVFKGWSDNAAIGSPIPEQPRYTRTLMLVQDTDIVANFECPTCNNVTITWNNWDGTLLKSVSQAEGTATTYTGSTPTKDATPAYTYTFDGWSTTLGGERAYKIGMTPKATASTAYYAHFSETSIPSLEVSNGVTQLTAPVTYHNLILSSDGTSSGQLLGEQYLKLTGNAYFDFKVNTQPRKWYAVAVPWPVDAATGISANGHSLALNRGVYVLTYDGARRATEGPKKTWTQLGNGEVLQPGTLYMVCVMENASSIRFAKKAGESLLTTTTSVSKYESQTGNDEDASWNGVSNPALFHAYVNAGVPIGQVYVSESDSYTPIVLNTTKLVVGQGAYVQVPANKDITVTQGGSFAAAAPRRLVSQNETSNYEVRIAPINKDFTDRVFIQTDDSKTPDVYTVGQDLSKMGVSTIVAQMWIDRYNTKLCLNTMAPINGEADYPLVISVPQEGKYTIDILRSTEKQPNELYLTRDGQIIWNLSQNAYTLTMEQGTTSCYGLRTISKAPQIATDVEETWVDGEDKVVKAAKVLIDNHVYIIRDGKVYTITGQTVKIQ